jgi:hypothetical protein
VRDGRPCCRVEGESSTVVRSRRILIGVWGGGEGRRDASVYILPIGASTF